ncbi:unnamed protein product [Lota lota]
MKLKRLSPSSLTRSRSLLPSPVLGPAAGRVSHGGPSLPHAAIPSCYRHRNTRHPLAPHRWPCLLQDGRMCREGGCVQTRPWRCAGDRRVIPCHV